jgi:two-component SAPR family response regulator
VPKWQLIDVFWPDRDDEKGEVNLRSTVFRLNRTLRECGTGMRVVPTHGGYELEGYPVITDLETYVGLMQNRDLKGLAEWLAHWDGQFLENIADPWAGTLRERVRLQMAEAGRLIAEDALAGRFPPWDALTAVEAVWKQEPYDESLQTALMRLLRKTRGRDAVMVWYHDLVLQLREELGVPPTMEVENTYREMSLD